VPRDCVWRAECRGACQREREKYVYEIRICIYTNTKAKQRCDGAWQSAIMWQIVKVCGMAGCVGAWQSVIAAEIYRNTHIFTYSYIVYVLYGTPQHACMREKGACHSVKVEKEYEECQKGCVRESVCRI